MGTSTVHNTTVPRVTVGPVTPAGTFRSSGSVRAAFGHPASFMDTPVSFDAGFAFADMATTGLFAHDDNASQPWSLSLMSNGTEKLVLPSSLSEPSSLFGSLHVSANLSVLGGHVALTPDHLLALHVPAANPLLLNINPDDTFSDGIVIGDHRLSIGAAAGDSSRTRVVAGNVPPAGTLRSAGSVRAAKGLPSGPSSTLDIGFAFDDDADSGLFLAGDLRASIMCSSPFASVLVQGEHFCACI